MEWPMQAKKNYRPAQVVLDYLVQRRMSDQVKADQAKAKAEAAATKAATIVYLQSQKDRNAFHIAPRAIRGNFRAAVNNLRQVSSPFSQLKKCKGLELSPPVDDNTSTKCTKTSKPGGLVPNWRKSVCPPSHIVQKHSVKYINDEDDFVEREFNRAEHPNMLNAMRASKPSLVRIDSKLITPCPIFKAPSSAWPKPNPYATNTLLKDTIMLSMWDIIYPDIDLNEEECRYTRVKLMYLAANILNDWRTIIETDQL
ncbi:hypothetical protein BGY98DRAFT_940228 [Russula aff. rugulosa BPL654]|nr:hypothetical protein BGY98DRAFT_940228 [Russula aff. rugulosa BPL654]